MYEGQQISRRALLQRSAMFAGAAALQPLWSSAFVYAQTSGQPAKSGLVASFEAAGAKTPVTTTPLAQNLYLLQGVGGNMAVLTGSDGKILIDSSVAAAAPRVKTALDAIDNQPLQLLINTHWHFDHTDGNAAMHAYGATILAHVNTRKRLMSPQEIEAMSLHFDPMPPAAWPVETFTDSVTLYRNQQEIHLAHFTPAHTDSDIFVHFPDANVLHTGDIWFNGFYPLIDDSSGGNINGMIDGANRALEISDRSTKIIPGHGPLGNQAALTQYRDMLATVRYRVTRLRQSGKSLQETIATKPTAELDAKWAKGGLSPDAFVTLVYKTVAV